ncbi:MAG: GLUG motif-containing protein [Phycisphaerales bacterium]
MTRFHRQSRILLIVTLAATMGLLATARGVEFAGGTGEPNDPYQVATPAQLLAIGTRQDLRQKSYILVNTIDLSGAVVTGSAIPSQFKGVLDGNGYTIENLGKKGNGCLGLFFQIGAGAEVKNLGILNARINGGGALAMLNQGSVQNCYSAVDVSGRRSVGGLVGGNSGVLSRCYSTGDVIGDVNMAGGLAGTNGGEISSCYSTSRVSCPSRAGGLVGVNARVMSDSHCTGQVLADANDIGGLVGFNSGEISRCYSTSPVTGAMYVGGLAGTNTGQIVSCYADANVVSEGAYVGGLVGDNWGGSIRSCYSTGVLAAADYLGGLVGRSDSETGIAISYSVARLTAPGGSVSAGGLVGEGIAENCYFLDPADGGGPDNGVGVPLTDAEMKQQASFVGWDFSGTADDGEADLWFMPENAYPILIWQAEVTDPNDNAAVSDGA